MRRAWLIGAIGLLMVVAVACEPGASPPEIGPVRRAPATSYRRDSQTETLASAAEGAQRVVVWGQTYGRLLLGRYDASGPVGDPVVVDRGGSDPSAFVPGWLGAMVALGDGFVLVRAHLYLSGAHGDDSETGIVRLIDPDGHRVPLQNGPASGLAMCRSGGGVAEAAMNWTGSAFLFVKRCASSTAVFRVSTSGRIELAATLPPVGTVALASGRSSSLLVYQDGTEVKAWRLADDGTLVGAALLLDTGAVGDSMAVSSSKGVFLAAWSIGYGALGGQYLQMRRVTADGRVGRLRVLVNTRNQQIDPTLAAAADGGWFAAWYDQDWFELNIYGTKISADGVPADANGHPIADLPGINESDPSLVTGPSNTAYLSWIRRDDDHEWFGLTRQLDADAMPSAPWIAASRMPDEQLCRSVAAGAGQYLVTWHEDPGSSGVSQQVYAQRYLPDGSPVGPELLLSDASGNQSCPTAAWNGSRWLVAWTDTRRGPHDLYGTLVSPDGVVSPRAGFPISASAGVQQHPVVAADGASWVVAWEDGRNGPDAIYGKNDIYAARISPDGTVLDPDGLRVSPGPVDYRSPPSLASTHGVTLIAWSGSGVAQSRILRSDGTFLAGPARLGRTIDDGPAVAASSSGFAVAYEDATRDAHRQHHIVLTNIDPASGTRSGRVPIDAVSDEGGGYVTGLELTYDGSRFVYSDGGGISDEPGFYGSLATISDGIVRTTRSGPIFAAARLASLGGGRSLLVSTQSFEPTITVAPVVDEP